MNGGHFWNHRSLLLIVILSVWKQKCLASTHCDLMQLEDSQIAQCTHRKADFTRNCADSQQWPEHTVAEIRCRPFWKSVGDSDKIAKICLNGKWESQLESSLTCKVACGVAGEETNGSGQNVQKGPWPWHVGIYTEVLAASGDFRYTCGGTLISTRAILTAAQCVTFPQQTVEYRTQDIRIQIGDFKYYAEDSEWKKKRVQKIVMHPDYNPSNYGANLAVIWLTENVKIGPYVHPICLPRLDEEVPSETRGKTVVYTNGTGHSATLPVVESDRCQQSSATHSLLVRPTTFCADPRKAPEVCNPVGGVGIAFETRVDRSSTKWTVHGVRLGVAVPDCQKPVVYTRVSKYQSWINHELKNREPPLYIEKVSIRPSATERSTTTRAVQTIIVTPGTIAPTRVSSTSTTRRVDDSLSPGPSEINEEFQRHPVNALYITSKPKQQSTGQSSNGKGSKNPTETTTSRPRTPSKTQEDQKRTTTTKRPSNNRNSESNTLDRSSTTSRTTRRPQQEDFYYLETNTTKRPDPKLKYHSSRPVCPPLPFTEGVQLNCEHGKDEEPDECQSGGWNGTKATYRCDKYYKSVYGTNVIQKTCSDRRLWLPAREFGCKLECGLSSRPKISYIVHGTVSDRVSWPWHAAVFRRTEEGLAYYCGGTLISRNVIMTAAHCVTQPTTSRIFDDEFQVVLAAVSSVYSDNEADRHARRYGVKNISIPDSYNPVTFESDIALMQLREDVELSDYIKPICWPSKNNFEYSQLELIHLAHDSVGYTVGFGLDETGEIGNALKETTLPYVTHRACGAALDRFPTSTQFCAGYRNGNGTSVCNGDSGGGIYFVDESNIYKRFILQGIISNGDPNEGSKLCNNNNYAVFTKVSSFSGWIERYLDAVENERLLFFASFASRDEDDDDPVSPRVELPFRSTRPGMRENKK